MITHAIGVPAEAIAAALRKRGAHLQRLSRAIYRAARTIEVSVSLIGTCPIRDKPKQTCVRKFANSKPRMRRCSGRF